MADETAIYTRAQQKTLSENLDDYVENLGKIVERKMQVYGILREKIMKLKGVLKEEEDFVNKMDK